MKCKKTNNIKFSICIPNYNCGNYIRQTIESVLSQTYPAYEIIIADNASTDDSIDIIKSFDSQKIKLIRNNYNIGYSNNLDQATISATGDYMLFLGADDMLKENALEVYTELILEHSHTEIGIIICAKTEIIKNGEVIGIKNQKGGKLPDILSREPHLNKSVNDPTIEVYNGADIFKILMTTNFAPPGPPQSTCYSKKIFDTVQGYNSPTVTAPDASFGHKICLVAPKIVYCNKTLAYFRMHDTSFTADINKIKNIKHLTDCYLLSLEFSDIQLKSAGLSRLKLQNAFTNEFCIRVSFWCLLTGRITKFYFHYIFGFATYPKIMLKQAGTYLIFTMILFTPIFYLFATVYRKFKKTIQQIRQ